MRVYLNPLFFFSLIVMALGLSILIRIAEGAYPTYLVIILPAISIGMILIDFRIRKSRMTNMNKVLFQILGLVLALFLCYTMFM